jgi:hypothetical protein
MEGERANYYLAARKDRTPTDWEQAGLDFQQSLPPRALASRLQ